MNKRVPATFHFSWPHILRKLPPAKVVSSKNFRDHPLFMARRGLGNRWGPPVFSKTLGVGMLNIRFGGSPNFCTENWVSCTFWVSQKKTIVIIIILTKEMENFLGPSICVQHSEVLRLLLGNFHIGFKV